MLFELKIVLNIFHNILFRHVVLNVIIDDLNFKYTHNDIFVSLY